MAITKKDYQVMQKLGDDDYLLLHPETNAGNVIVDVDGIEAKDASAAFSEIKSAVDNKANISDIPDVSQFITRAVSDLVNYYAKSAIDDKISDIENKITLTTGEKITLVILGFNHDNLSDGSGKAGLTLGTKNALATSYPMNASSTNTGGWAGSVMRQTTMVALLGYLPSEVQAAIKTVNKITGRYDSSPRGQLETTEDKLFLFSQEEVMGTHYWTTTGQLSFPGEGQQYEYFKKAPIPAPTSGTGSFTSLEGTGCFYTTDTAVASGYNNRFNQAKSTSANRYYNYNNAKAQGDSATTSCLWWLRSPYYNNSNYFCCVSGAGGSDCNIANDSCGVAFGFCV